MKLTSLDLIVIVALFCYFVALSRLVDSLLG